MEILAEYGYWGLFLASFLAATILPFSSEVVLGYLLSHDFSVVVTIGVATSGNVLGSVVNYGLGFWGSRLLLDKVLGISPREIEKAENRFKTYGVFSLLFAWVPVIGDPLTVAAGILRLNFVLFLLLVSIGKFLRYVFVSWAVLSI
ncbi:MAG: DedA family protein [Proteobacteria bacterium]|nr:DedA family protein [Pseudomonadota bacterium]MBU1583597.1 DedA family protein [Pseudomonadota bacterium]MBU2452488.1 DedA family protein [Pseudomonadota bacterium]MBU2629899.1 DedA family protein [Pseudomonadota bacterium]